MDFSATNLFFFFTLKLLSAFAVALCDRLAGRVGEASGAGGGGVPEHQRHDAGPRQQVRHGPHLRLRQAQVALLPDPQSGQHPVEEGPHRAERWVGPPDEGSTHVDLLGPIPIFVFRQCADTPIPIFLSRYLDIWRYLVAQFTSQKLH